MPEEGEGSQRGLAARTEQETHFGFDGWKRSEKLELREVLGQ